MIFFFFVDLTLLIYSDLRINPQVNFFYKIVIWESCTKIIVLYLISLFILIA